MYDWTLATRLGFADRLVEHIRMHFQPPCRKPLNHQYSSNAPNRDVLFQCKQPEGLIEKQSMFYGNEAADQIESTKCNKPH